MKMKSQYGQFFSEVWNKCIFTLLLIYFGHPPIGLKLSRNLFLKLIACEAHRNLIILALQAFVDSL